MRSNLADAREPQQQAHYSSQVGVAAAALRKKMTFNISFIFLSADSSEMPRRLGCMEGQSGQKEHFLILINDFLILINDLLISINDLLILRNHLLILKTIY